MQNGDEGEKEAVKTKQIGDVKMKINETIAKTKLDITRQEGDKPKAVRKALKKGLKVKRQGELFFIPLSKETKIRDIPLRWRVN